MKSPMDLMADAFGITPEEAERIAQEAEQSEGAPAVNRGALEAAEATLADNTIPENGKVNRADLVERFIADAEAKTGIDRYEGAGYTMVSCPSHEDGTPSLSVSEGDRGVVFTCQAGCEYEDILDAMGWKPEATFYDHKETEATSDQASAPEVEAEVISTTSYEYKDANGHLVAVNTRYDYSDGKKTFNWQPKTDNPLRIYGAENIARAKNEDRLVWVVEGEKCVDALNAIGEIAVSVQGGVNGAAKNADDLAGLLAGCRILICPDGDLGGKRWEAAMQAALADEYPTTVDTKKNHWKDGYDIADWLRDNEGLDPRSLKANGSITRRSHEIVNLKAIEWLWEGRLQHGAINVVGAYEGQGKSTFANWVCAALSKGELEGAFYGKPQNSLILAREEDHNIVVAKLVAHGADLSRITVIDQTEALEKWTEVGWWHRTMRNAGHPVLVVGDPFTSLLWGRRDIDDAQVREVFDEIREALSDPKVSPNGTTFLAIRHCKKTLDWKQAAEMDPLNLLTGSRAGIVGAARIVLMAFQEEVNGKLYMGVSLEKGNNALVRETPVFAGEITKQVVNGNIKTLRFAPAPAVSFEDGYQGFARRQYAKSRVDANKGTDRGEAIDAILEVVAKNGGWVAGSYATEIAENRGVNAERGKGREAFHRDLAARGLSNLRARRRGGPLVWFDPEMISEADAKAAEQLDYEQWLASQQEQSGEEKE